MAKIPPVGHSAYDPRYFDKLANVEDRHFWFRTRNRVLSTVARQLTKNWQPGYHVLEIGCGTGNVLRTLEAACRGGHVIGMDLFEEGLRHARRRSSCPLVRGDAHMPPFGKQFPLIGMFDVLEHVSDDLNVLRRLHSQLPPGGILMLTVPAHMSLWSYFDEGGHFRRYSRKELEDKLRSTGFEIYYITEFMFLLFPLLWLGRRFSARSLARGAPPGELPCTPDLSIIPVLNEVLALALTIELPFLSRRWRIPIGSSILAVAQKPGPR